MLTSKARFNTLYALVLAITALMLIPSASAGVAVSLGNAAAAENTAALSCSAEAINDTLSITELYIGINALELNQTDAACSGKSECTSNFSVGGLQNGTWSWNCKAYNADNDGFLSPANGSFTITSLLETQTPAGQPSQPAQTPPAAPVARQPARQDAARCGDGACNGQEDCATCAQDCKCDAGTVCNKTGRCEKKSSLPLYLLIGLAVMGIAGFFIARAKLRSPKGEEEPNPAPESIAQQPQTQETAPVEQQEVQMPPEPKSGEWEPSMPGGTKTPQQEPQMPSETPVHEYIRLMRQKGKTDLEISQKLRKSGWKDYEIAMALLTLKKEKAQKQR